MARWASTTSLATKAMFLKSRRGAVSDRLEDGMALRVGSMGTGPVGNWRRCKGEAL